MLLSLTLLLAELGTLRGELASLTLLPNQARHFDQRLLLVRDTTLRLCSEYLATRTN